MYKLIVKTGPLVQYIGGRFTGPVVDVVGRSVSGTSGLSSAISCRSPHPAKTTLQGTHLVIHRHYIQSNPRLHSVHSPMQFHFRGQRCRVQVRETKRSLGYSQLHKYALQATKCPSGYSLVDVLSCTNLHSIQWSPPLGHSCCSSYTGCFF